MNKDKKWIVIFLLPGVLLFIFVFLLSLIVLFTTAFCDWKIGSEITFSGLDNFIYLFTQDQNFLKSIVNTLIWIVLQATIHVGIGVLLALILAKKRWYSNIVRTIFFIPNIISSAALGLMFLCFFNPQFGLVNNVLSQVLGKEVVHNWFINPSTAFLTVTLTWLPFAGLITILVMAEMMSIPEDIYEAASIDGATTIQTNLKIVLPMMRNIIGTTTVLAASSMLQKLDIIMMTTSGGPGVRTMNMPMYLYRTALTENNYGLANAQGVVLIAVGVVVLFTIRKTYKMNEEI